MDKNFDVLGLKFNAMKLNEMIDYIYNVDVSNLSIGVSFIGVPGVNLALKDEKIMSTFNSIDICSIDGAPVAKLAKKCKIDCERCAGPDVMKGIIEKGLSENKRHYFYGGTEETLKSLISNLKKAYPEIKICGQFSPPFRALSEKERNDMIEDINNSKPDFVWVGLGQPKQDIWVLKNKDKIKNAIILGVGAAFNFFAGTVKRAPKWIQKIGLEWVYRLSKEPKYLFRRYFFGGFEWKKNLRKYKRYKKKMD